MPELPEVETIRRQLSERLSGRTIVGVRVLDARLVEPEEPGAFAEALRGELIHAVERRAKYLLFRLASGDTLVMHLRMTGRLHWRAGAPDAEEPHLRARLDLDDGGTVVFRDVRRFGRAWVVPAATPDLEGYWAERAGVEPLSARFTARRLGALVRGRRASIKAVLLDQRLVAGLGNMYVDEALFGARIHPLRPAGSLDATELRRLHRSIRDRLAAAVAAGGASIDTYRDGLGQRGRMQDLLRVHLRRGEPCWRCGATICKARIAQRGTYWCPRCQVTPSAAPAGTPC